MEWTIALGILLGFLLIVAVVFLFGATRRASAAAIGFLRSTFAWESPRRMAYTVGVALVLMFSVAVALQIVGY